MRQNFRTYDLAKQLYHEVQTLRLHGDIRDQLTRASLSIVLNLAEGAGKLTPKDRRRFFAMALGSARECHAIFDLIQNVKLMTMADSIAAQTYRLCQTPGTLFPRCASVS